MLHLLLALTFTWTNPSTVAATADSCPVGCHSTTDSTLAYTPGLVAVEIWCHQQSATWAAKKDSMQADPAIWTKYWPVVRSEAAWRRYGAVVGPFTPGLTTSITIPDTTARDWAVRMINTRGRASCLSNEVAK